MCFAGGTATLYLLAGGAGAGAAGLCLRVCGLLTCAPPLVIVLRFSRGTSGSAPLVVLAGAVLLPLLLLGAGLLLVGPPLAAVAGLLLALAASAALLLAYASLYGSARFDAKRNTPP